MFSGIVDEVGIIKSIETGKLTISAHEALKETSLGDSIAVNGICLTATTIGSSSFSADVMPETLRRTNLGILRPGDSVNLERALAVGGRFGGHFVQGHIDGTGKIISVVPEQEALLLTIAAPAEIMHYIVEKGFIAVDGVSLTITGCDDTSFGVSLVAYTRQGTTLGYKKTENVVNLEIDILAKYMDRLRERGGEEGMKKDPSGISYDFLADHGFLAM
ncbi:riboflavin synthase [Chloroflexota bacterium]